jgi:hypothetical protein
MPAEAGSAVREEEREITEENFVIMMNDEL